MTRPLTNSEVVPGKYLLTHRQATRSDSWERVTVIAMDGELYLAAPLLRVAALDDGFLWYAVDSEWKSK